MKIRNDLAKSVVEDYITETFTKFEPNIKNFGNAFLAKMFVHNHFDQLTQIISKDGYIDITALESFASSDIDKLGKFEVPGVGTKYLFTSDDIRVLINKMKEKADA